jgi:toxin ParE1/3/4
MFTEVRRTARAEEDLLDIWLYIAVDNPQAADRLVDRLDSACARLAAHPLSGPSREDIGAGVRHLVVENYLILYRYDGKAVEIVRILHGQRRLGVEILDQ